MRDPITCHADHIDWFEQHGTEQLMGETSREAPREMHLREVFDFDVDDADQLVSFVESYGDPRHAVSPVDPSAPLAESRMDLPFAPVPGLRSTQASLRQLAHGVTLIRLLADHAEAALRGEPVGPIWQHAGAFDLRDTDERLNGEILDADVEDGGWRVFSDLLNRGLKVVHPVVVPAGTDARLAIASTFEVACVLIFNDLAESLPYSYCADETCGRRFKRQIGRAAQREGRRGAKFCSPQHARNQSQRERRRAARTKGEAG
ncbi:hypothetical protein [Aeromicrobium piscarium]|uniref:Uncharacterized protein n=1 Tax=Aeromicrobium piscarium TaxID=2590901 RepID=A0A554S8Y3_9ACTN|nr:hypothetical protein [Aeromicrobium piscarium]TSD62807.1 hypothetical protein FNM00_10570 [Aeromicrobium piscarium]